MTSQRSVYLDFNATTPPHPEALEAMLPYYKDNYGNASALHRKGRAAHAALEESRTIIGDCLGTESVDIIFTSGGTESNNFAIRGTAFKNRKLGNHIITSSIEHLSVLEVCRSLKLEGFDITYLKPDKCGLINPADVEKAIKDTTILVSVMHVNNEVGTIEPIKEIAKVVKRTNENRKPKTENRIYFHTDSVQAMGKIAIDVEELGIDLLSISAHKIYGPKGTGALYIRKVTEIQPYCYGGHQERNLRAGTENIPAIVGFAKAAELAVMNLKENKRIGILRDSLCKGLLSKISDVKINGDLNKGVSNTLSLAFAGVDADSLAVNMDIKGIFASAGSACTSGAPEASRVLEAMGIEPRYAKGSIRFSLGISTTDSDISYCIETIPALVEHLRLTHINT